MGDKVMRIFYFIGIVIVAVMFSGAAQAKGHKSKISDFLIKKKSSYTVSETLDRFEKVIKSKGISVFARVNHSAGAKKVNMSLRPTELIIFGNPKLGTPLMISNQLIGIDLPLKALSWEDEKGQVWLGYILPRYLQEKFSISDKPAVFKKMTGALDKLTNAALKAAK